MYCGNNKTALASQRLIAEATLSLLEEVSYTEISVSAICRRAEVSRQTFYTLFKSKENVITYALRNDCCYAPSTQITSCTVRFEDICEGFSSYIIYHAEILKKLSENEILPLLRTVLKEDLASCPLFSEKIDPVIRPYAIDFMAAGITSIAEVYVRSNNSYDKDSLAVVISKLLRGSYLISDL